MPVRGARMGVESSVEIALKFGSEIIADEPTAAVCWRISISCNK